MGGGRGSTRQKDGGLTSQRPRCLQIEEYYTNTETIKVSFVGYKTGIFEYGDDSKVMRRGLLVVE